MKRFLGKLLNIILVLMIVLLALILLSGLVQRMNKNHPYTGLFGTGYAVVVSGSMEPKMHVNDLIVYHKQPASSYEIGDIVVYIRDEGGEEMLITHRIIRKSPSGVTTKGDANTLEDPAEVPYSAIVGKVIFRLPYMGVVTSFLRHPFGITITVLLIGVLLLLRYLTDRHEEENRRKFLD